MKKLICPYCFLNLEDLEDLVAHLQCRHDYPLQCDKKYVIERLKRVGWKMKKDTEDK